MPEQEETLPEDNFCDDCIVIDDKEVEATHTWRGWRLCCKHFQNNVDGWFEGKD